MLQVFRRNGRASTIHPHVRSLTTLATPPPLYTLWLFNRPHEIYRPATGCTAIVDLRQDIGEAIRDRRRHAEPIKANIRAKGAGQKKWLNGFNRSLIAASKDKNSVSNRIKLWRMYSHVKSNIPNILSALPDRAWDLLWDTQSIPSSTNPNCRNHQRQLIEDMNSVGRISALGQRLADLETTYISGKKQDALRRWEEEHKRTFGATQDGYKGEHLELGVRMHALSRNIDRARHIMEELFAAYPTWDPRVMIAVLQAHTKFQDGGNRDRAWALYIRLKTLLASKMTLADYDACFVAFLECQQIDYATAIFRDMVLAGHLAKRDIPGHDVQLTGRLRAMYLLSNSVGEVNKVALTAISVLPQRYHSSIFRHWMKMIVSKNAVESAAQVIELMFERGLESRTSHFDLLLAALFRIKKPAPVQKAESIGWQMIDAKLDQASAHENRPPMPFFLKRSIPRASSNTFALLIRHHTDQWQWDHVRQLQGMLTELETPPNCALMNSLMYVDLRRGKYEEVWVRYQAMTHPPPGYKPLFPNGATYHYLWKTLRLALGDHQTWAFESLPSPRDMMAQMLEWSRQIGRKPTLERSLIGLTGPRREIVSLIMHCFCHTEDLSGALVAIHAMKSRFRIFPTYRTAGILFKHMANNHTGVFKDNVLKLEQIYKVILQRRLNKMNQDGSLTSRMTEEQSRELSLDLLSEFIRVIMVRQCPAEEVEALIDKAKKEMGVPDLSTGDLDSFDVVQ
ncbi:hypothetical protein AOQ84DRAFT_280290 [Glonium stellatum]|uniref:Pentatricopeptide repeat-containing protein n=1 Tax=Glonium stellatum TaxID=574774 RepID=A0A8E2FCS3_9PEZI|nr:hypothetical protein AOQ84DRAFT_280290 [Glonium stellatum]